MGALLGGAATLSNTTSPSWVEVYLRTKWHFGPFSRLATTDMGQKLGGAVPFFWGELDPIEQKVAWAEAYIYLHTSGILVHPHPAVWPQRTLDKNWRWGYAFREGGAGSPSNTMSPRLRLTSVPSDILIHTAVWPQ